MSIDRKIRFLYPPMYFAIALAWAFWLGSKECFIKFAEELAVNNTVHALGLTAVAGFAILSTGYFIGTFPIVVLRLLALGYAFFRLWCCRCGFTCSICERSCNFKFPYTLNYESVLSSDRFDDVWKKHLGGEGDIVEREKPYLAAAFDHGVLSDGHKDWIERRWSAFNVSMNSGSALLFATVCVLFSIEPGWCWYMVVISLAAMFFVAAAFAWYDTCQMNNLLARTLPLARPGTSDADEQAKSEVEKQ